MSQSTANALPPEKVTTRWTQLYSTRSTELCAQKVAVILENPEIVAEYRTPVGKFIVADAITHRTDYAQGQCRGQGNR